MPTDVRLLRDKTMIHMTKSGQACESPKERTVQSVG